MAICGLYQPAYLLLQEDIGQLKPTQTWKYELIHGELREPILSTDTLALNDDIWPILRNKTKSQACSTLCNLEPWVWVRLNAPSIHTHLTLPHCH